jgi:hypothetical protein
MNGVPMREPNPLSIASLAFLMSVPGYARAEPCEGSVARSGSLFGGQQFRVEANIPQLSVVDAFRQLRAIYQISNIKVVGEDRAIGALKAELKGSLLEQPQMIDVFIREEGGVATLQMTYGIAPGELVISRSIAKHMCSVLTQIRGGVSVQSLGARASLRDTATSIEATELARRVDAAASNPAKLDVDFVGRRFQVIGRVLSISEANAGYAVWFEGLPLPDANEPDWGRPRLAVKCMVPKQRANAAAGLTVKMRGVLVGRFLRLDTDPRAPAVILQDCDAP